MAVGVELGMVVGEVVAVAVGVGVSDEVGVGVLVAVGTGDEVEVGVLVAVGVGVGDAVVVCVAVGTVVGESVADGSGDGDSDGMVGREPTRGPLGAADVGPLLGPSGSVSKTMHRAAKTLTGMVWRR